MTSVTALLPVAAFALGLLSAIGGFWLYVKSSVQKKYAAERDFQHLKRNQEQIVQMLVHLDDEIKDIRIELVRLSAH